MSLVRQGIKACRICGNADLDPVLDLGSQYLTGVFPRSADMRSTLTKGPLELVKCRDSGSKDRCGLLQLRHSYPSSEMYGANYGYRSSLNRSMVDHLESKVRRIVARGILAAGDCILDIGSNDATLLKAYPGRDFRLIGMDPSGAKFSHHYPPHIKLVADFFSATAFDMAASGRRAKIVTSIAMFYDLENPLEFMRQLRDILADDGIWVFEQSYMPTMLELGSYDTVCHEHVEYYALAQIKWMLDRAGMKILEVELNSVNGGSFSVTAAKANSPLAADEAGIARLLASEHARLDTMAPYEAFSRGASRHRDSLIATVRGINARGGTIVGYGASTKGNVILQYCGLGPEDLPCIADVNEDKFGCFTPGSGIPIVSESEAHAMKPDYLLVLPWHFRDNIVQREDAYLRSGGRLIFPLPEIAVVGGAD
jgi:NDP-4-keto-2,6-dideoxyhexose 3-C-methyltransferase